ncbi:MAG: hypothetical protein KF873_11545 [Gemmataceae bacterium]|nr:hypothetical protein [Planctomycetia bacterium]MBX3399369.1 hypothetical protein [Gemmataceae bacterium]
MSTVVVKVPTDNAKIAEVHGWIVTVKKKTNGSGAKRKIFVSDIDQAVQNRAGTYWILSLSKRSGQRIVKNILYITAVDRRGRVIDRLVRKCKP